MPDLGRPQAEDTHSMARRWKAATGSRKPALAVPVLGRAARAFKERKHHTPNRADGAPTFDEWLATRELVTQA